MNGYHTRTSNVFTYSTDNTESERVPEPEVTVDDIEDLRLDEQEAQTRQINHTRRPQFSFSIPRGVNTTTTGIGPATTRISATTATATTGLGPISATTATATTGIGATTTTTTGVDVDDQDLEFTDDEIEDPDLEEGEIDVEKNLPETDPFNFMHKLAQHEYDSFQVLTDKFYELLEAMYNITEEDGGGDIKLDVSSQMNLVRLISTLNESMKEMVGEIEEILVQVDTGRVEETEASKERRRQATYSRKVMNKFMPMMIAYSLLMDEETGSFET